MLKLISVGLLSTLAALAVALAAPASNAAMRPPAAVLPAPQVEAPPSQACSSGKTCAVRPDCNGPAECKVTAERQPDGTCRIECTDETGNTCSFIVDCEETSCETPRPCERVGGCKTRG